MNEFSKLVSDFFIRYLTNQKNASENTIKTEPSLTLVGNIPASMNEFI